MLDIKEESKIMAKLVFTSGVMGSGKSLDLIRVAYNYKEKGLNPIVFKPRIDTRDGVGDCVITSRTGASCNATWINEEDDLYDRINYYTSIMNVDVVMIDEVQFLTYKQIMQLSDIVTKLGIPVLAYGLKNNFKGELFEPIRTLLAYCDEVRTCIGLCWCKRKANHNARLVDGVIAKHGEEIQLGGNESYIALCNKHFKEENLGNIQ
jgi:Thymidine kinase